MQIGVYWPFMLKGRTPFFWCLIVFVSCTRIADDTLVAPGHAASARVRNVHVRERVTKHAADMSGR